MACFTRVVKETCIACGTCGAIAPEVFEYDDSGFSESVLDNNEGIAQIPEDLVDDVEEAFDSCPSDSIKLSTAPFQQEATASAK